MSFGVIFYDILMGIMYCWISAIFYPAAVKTKNKLCFWIGFILQLIGTVSFLMVSINMSSYTTFVIFSFSSVMVAYKLYNNDNKHKSGDIQTTEKNNYQPNENEEVITKRKKEKGMAILYIYVYGGLFFPLLNIISQFIEFEMRSSANNKVPVLTFFSSMIYYILRFTVSILYVRKNPGAYKVNIYAIVFAIICGISSLIEIPLLLGSENLANSLGSFLGIMITNCLMYIYLRNRKDLLDSGNY